ncbi:hypothetical protein RHMOL_Rhmol11G0030900 [Rhododendron molle]|uniref:Uncharacterized protein n=1 Tax=Rhododendron molle TaxID=49168 RepID=A0ACC0LPD5_RHOML|nr:hypothetical protein RHMOL_Rhmol11G0030900 [Rhododendron molle]
MFTALRGVDGFFNLLICKLEVRPTLLTKGTNPSLFSRSTPLEVSAGPPAADQVQRQLEQISAALSIWGLICSSREHRQKLCHALSRLEIQADVTPEAMVSLILPPTSKHTVVFTDKDLPVERVDHNCPLHITVKC